MQMICLLSLMSCLNDDPMVLIEAKVRPISDTHYLVTSYKYNKNKCLKKIKKRFVLEQSSCVVDGESKL